MGGLGRVIALPLLLIALALQGLAPAQATAMPKDAFGLPICSAHDLGGTQRRDPAQDRPHDCCAAACALAGVACGPPPLAQIAAAAFGVPLRQAIQPLRDAPASARDRRPNARGPPAPHWTI